MIELANRDIALQVGIARVCLCSGKKIPIPSRFHSNSLVSGKRSLRPLILGRPFLRTARALIDVHGEEMILRDGDERLILNMRNDTSRYSNTPQKESINMIDIYNISHKEYLEDLFANEKITNHPRIDYLPFDAESDLREIELLLKQDPIEEMDSILEDFKLIKNSSRCQLFVDILLRCSMNELL
ncbi:hypothetical protein Tco_0820335 [Tanacetum coccineum]|uniref:Reverse transcriptase domain-containing protein n=1 Tax=Tanacetum coccineum TaxID=301880 RepID=A0ABQ5A962_9ASTR